MHKYNIIYRSPNKEIYLWNGNSFDKLDDEEREVLLYSGQSVNAEDAAEALAAGKAAAKMEFPGDENPDIKKVSVKVS
ncbi:hypothetical protein [Mucilaginibacter flavidus]|uniref:hypothetical protein n=1 Tax=Mucilaginibacter flavidus TaxID=2949309 RepID=UPI002092DCD2|nr:hypothetical protein [Mucilaginibacter flavidus]MCO5948841.1 hypothetical protein [Mucilaginibacter flavidus]